MKHQENGLLDRLIRGQEKLDHELIHGLERLDRKLNQIEREIDQKHQHITDSVANVFTGEFKMADNALVFNVGQTSIDTLTPRLADGSTPSGGVISNVVVTFSDPSATFVLNPDNTVTYTAVAASSGPISGSTALTITDTDGIVSTWNIPFTVQTNGVIPPAQLTQSVSNVFSVPTP